MSVQRLVNSYGSSVMAAYVAANRIDSVAIQVIVSIGTALSVFTGQNMGQNNFARIHEGQMCIRDRYNRLHHHHCGRLLLH